MKAKIIADIFVILSALAIMLWWIFNVPLSATISQRLAIVLSAAGVGTLVGVLIKAFLFWIHEGER